MTQKIIICGFPHCGTSILKSIIGHIPDVEEIFYETDKINKKTDKKFILCKYPFTKKQFFEKEYENYIKIFIIRNPFFVFSSLNKRFNYKIPYDHSIEMYINTIKKFIKRRNNNEKNIYTIRYEDMFDNNFQVLRTIFDDIGMKYENKIFNNTEYTNIIRPGLKINKKKPKNTNHNAYRTWQINQPLIFKNDILKIDLIETQKKKMINDDNILKIYPNINDIMDKC